LIGGQGTIGMRKCDCEMSENLGGLRSAEAFGRRIRRRTTTLQSRTNSTLSPVESLPNALPGSGAARTLHRSNGRGDAVGDDLFQKRQQRASGQARPSDSAGNPNAKRPSASGPTTAIAAKDSPCTEGFSSAAVVVSEEGAMPIECANPLAMRTRGLLESLGYCGPLSVGAVEPSLPVHLRPGPQDDSDGTGAVEGRGLAGSEKTPRREEAGSQIKNRPQNRNRSIAEMARYTASPTRMAIRQESAKNAIRVR
jgi:hypothetical protein